MLDSIHGRLGRREPTRVVVEAPGLGYEVHVPLSTYDALPASGEPVTLLLHLVVREDEWKLFGFHTAQERKIFRALLRVTGVGPMTALGLLSGLRPAELTEAVRSGDVKTLVRVKGVGRKTAERIVVDLRDVLEGAQGEIGRGVGEVAAPGPAADAVAALVRLGIDGAEASRRVEKVRQSAPDADVSEWVRRALRG